MIEFVKAKKNYLLMLAVFFVFISLSETTYSLFLHQDITDQFNYNTGSLNLEFKEDKPITLANAFPNPDSEGLKQEPYRLTVKNTGNLPQLFTLRMISENDSSISYNYIKIAIDSTLPRTLTNIGNIIARDVLIYPNEEKTFNIKLWLDYDTPNTEISKSFTAKIVASAEATYKTLDKSGANHPVLTKEMLPVSYSETDKSWYTVDENNMNKDYMWYNYSDKLWANSLTIKEGSKYIFDTTRNNDLNNTNVKVNNSNLIVDDAYLDIGMSNYNYSQISQIIRIKATNLNENYIYIISNGNISYYYDCASHKFVFKNGNRVVTSSEFVLEKDKWYILGYTYDMSKITFYANGTKIGTENISGGISNGASFKLGTNDVSSKISKLTIGDALTYNRLLTDNEIATNYKISMNLITDGLLSGYQQFTPMTLKEYYLNSDLGTKINDNDISAFYVWIPRYKYRVWNVTGKSGIDSYNAYKNGVDITFENGQEKTGIITCQNNICFNDASSTKTVSEADNSKSYTHPAFTNNGEELLGFWVNKYELSLDNNNNVLSIPNANILKGSTFDSYFASANKNSLITNTEWGAIAYLTHSNYGICSDNKCGIVTPNKTTISGQEPNDSTTGNIYGIFDMAGGAAEYTSSIISSNNKNKDYETYTPNAFYLGDATQELQLTDGLWNQNTYSNFDEDNTWIIRGGNVTSTTSGLFTYTTSSKITSSNLTTRNVIK